MSETVVGILGFICIIAIVFTLFKSLTQPSIAFIVFPALLTAVSNADGSTFDKITRNVIDPLIVIVR